MLYREGSHFYRGVEHQQTEPAFAVLETILKEQKPDLIIEIGTGMGGCTVFFSEFAPVITYDIVDRTANKIRNIPNIDFRLKDVFAGTTHAEIVAEIKRDNRKIFLMCDGEAKAQEIRTFAPWLKPGDIVFCHDWEDQFGWDDVKDTIEEFGFENVEKELCDNNKTNLQGWKKI